MATCKNQIYHAIAYYRLSKDDGDKGESNSISNQRKLINEFISTRDDIKLIREEYDDGYTGTNFERPGFQKMMADIQKGVADCIIVKDLSRLGRDYIDTGRYIQNVFPTLGVRFIAINDSVDSKQNDQSDDIIIPFKNLINDSYCRDLSIKLRGQFRVQRSNGDFMGAFAYYGYLKSPEDKHKLIPDEYASMIVKEIFHMKVMGYSQQGIADKLNEMGILAPAEYKRSIGMNFKSGFQVKSKSIWLPVTITRILKNRIYIGDLEQGKRSTPNYKVKKMMEKDKSEWIVVQNNHEPIIEKDIFEAVGRMLERDTRISPKNGVLLPLSGVLYCGDCGRLMTRRSVKRGKKKFHYYVCSTNKKGNGCSSHSFSQEKLENVIIQAINRQIETVVELESLIQKLGNAALQHSKMKKLDVLIEEKYREIDENKEYRLRLYESMVDELITHDEYVDLRQKYAVKIEKAENILARLEKEREDTKNGLMGDRSWMGLFLKHGKITELTRDLVVTLIDKIDVYEDKRIEITFNFKNEFTRLTEYVNTALEEVG